MKFIFSNIFELIFFAFFPSQKDNNPKFFSTRTDRNNISVSSCAIEKLLPITENGGIFSYMW